MGPERGIKVEVRRRDELHLKLGGADGVIGIDVETRDFHTEQTGTEFVERGEILLGSAIGLGRIVGP